MNECHRLTSDCLLSSWMLLEISPAKNSPTFSSKSQRDLAEILKSRRPKARRDSRQDLVEISKSRWPKTRRERFEVRSRQDSRRHSHRNKKKILAEKLGVSCQDIKMSLHADIRGNTLVDKINTLKYDSTMVLL